jgi:hypothetical protein
MDLGSDRSPDLGFVSGALSLKRRLVYVATIRLSCQEPQRRSLARDAEAIAHWKHYIWPQIKKVAGTRRNPDFSR